LFAGVIIRILYGASFHQAVSALRIVVWYTTFSYLGAVRNIWILAEGKQRYLWMINLSGAVANVLLNAGLIPEMGVNGAALASLVTQIFTNVVVGFLIEPIRKNNVLMLRGLNPKYVADVFRFRS
jgi:O-antigen/teichoic acid export membrane protein